MSVGASDNKNAKGVNYVAPDGGWGWIVVISSLFIHVIMDGIIYAFGQYLTIFVDDFESSHTAVSFIHSLLPAVTFVCGPIGSSLTNRLGCRLATMIGAVIATIGFVLSIFVNSVYLLYVTLGVVVGIGFGLVYVPAIVSVGYYFEKRRSFALGIAVCGAGIGTFAFAPINRYLLNRYDWQGAFLVKAGIVFNICLCATVMRPVPIEPSEILKRKRKLEKKLKDQAEHPEKYIEQLKKEQAVTKGQSMPSVFEEEPKNEIAELQKSLNELRDEEEKAKTQEDALYKSYSSLNFVAVMQSHTTLNNPNENDFNNKDISEPKKILMKSEETPSETKPMFDFKLLLNVLFALFAISNFLTSLGFNAPYIYVNDQAIKLGISPTNADWILQAIGISNMVARIVLGFISDFKFKIIHPKKFRLFLYSSVITICGLATMIEPFLTTFPALLVYGAVFGFTSGGYVTLTALILVDLLGLDNLSSAFGILLVFQGAATAIGPPIAGAMYDHFKSYTIAFLFIGSMIAVSGVMCFFIPCFKSYKKTLVTKEEEEKEQEMK